MISFINNETKNAIESEVSPGLDGLYIRSITDELNSLVYNFLNTRFDLKALLEQSKDNPKANRVATKAIAQEFLKANKDNRDLFERIFVHMKQSDMLISVELSVADIFNSKKILIESKKISDIPPTRKICLPKK